MYIGVERMLEAQDLRLGNSRAFIVDTGLIRKRQKINLIKYLKEKFFPPIIVPLQFVNNFTPFSKMILSEVPA
jgi:hypothetical protein